MRVCDSKDLLIHVWTVSELERICNAVKCLWALWNKINHSWRQQISSNVPNALPRTKEGIRQDTQAWVLSWYWNTFPAFPDGQCSSLRSSRNILRWEKGDPTWYARYWKSSSTIPRIVNKIMLTFRLGVRSPGRYHKNILPWWSRTTRGSTSRWLCSCIGGNCERKFSFETLLAIGIFSA
jgi:hypothetical protein